MLSSTVDMYQATIDGINKNRTTILIPAKWNRLINDALLDYSREHIVKGEVNQKRIDDLRMLYVTDEVNSISSNSFPLPDGTTVNNTNGILLPLYLRLLGTAFKINYVDNKCRKQGLSDWIYETHVMKSDRRNVIKRNPFRQPKDEKIYHRQIGNIIEIDTGTSSTAAVMHIEYWKFPRQIFYNTNGGNVDQVGTIVNGLLTFDYTGVTPGSVNCDLPEEQRQEVVDNAVRIYVERSQDPRYKSVLTEEQITGPTK